MVIRRMIFSSSVQHQDQEPLLEVPRMRTEWSERRFCIRTFPECRACELTHQLSALKLVCTEFKIEICDSSISKSPLELTDTSFSPLKRSRSFVVFLHLFGVHIWRVGSTTK
jgi:hypothetical protein